MAEKISIKNLTLEELKNTLVKSGEAPYRANQLFLSLYQKGVHSFGDISNMPGRLKEKLEREYSISSLKLSRHLKSLDGTEKFLFKLEDGNFIETVLIKAKKRITVCLSTQVGCRFKCLFCASGMKGFTRNLTPAEILDQVMFLRHKLKHNITNYVFMGMGEPLDNCENVSKAISIMNSPQGMKIGARRITISTCGILPGIKKLAELGLEINLSVSIHAADNRLRNKLVPVNKKYPLNKLIASCEEYLSKSGRLLTLEYVLIKGINDSTIEAEKLAKIAKRLNAKVNLIAASPIPGISYKAPPEKRIDAFMTALAAKGIKTTLRQSKGRDIMAACGQLAGEAIHEI